MPVLPRSAHAVPTPLPPGTPAPDFPISSGPRGPLRLRDLQGHPVVLAFFPPAWDPSHREQLALYNRLMRQLPGDPPELVGIVQDGLWYHLTFARPGVDAAPDGAAGGAAGAATALPLLADLAPDGAVARTYGVTGGHAVFVLDADGIIRWRHADAAGVPAPPAQILNALAELQRAQRAALPTRRDFMAVAFAAAYLLAMRPGIARAEAVAGPAAPPVPAPRAAGAIDVMLKVNGRPLKLTLDPRVTLLDALREYAGLTGTKKGCDHGQCGACTVHVNGRRIVSCLTFAVMHQGQEITTIEGLAQGGALHPMQAAFIEHDGFQCGYCTPGQIMSATALLREPCGPNDADVRECMSGNICRCGAYPNIVAAVQQVRRASLPPG
ncbi:MAG TPA: 2Fe-2S iron-sulfur cluster-binding protein [Gemmatimonadales bacterium]|nr:2Fe-2S iron-sulfur cluster-binding protein [Gemmatimonadales bacterium]